MSRSVDATTLIDVIRAGDAEAFAALAEQHRRALHVHCYRMLGSFDEAEDLVQETLLRAWRARSTFEGRSLFRTWLYRIATNACLNALERAPRRFLPQDVAAPVTAGTDASEARSEPPRAPEVPWLQPYPDRWLEPIASSDSQPEAVAVTRESIELTFLAALQHLPPRQRAVLVLRDVLEMSASETAEQVGTSVAAVNSAHQRARGTLRTLLGAKNQAGAGVTSSLAAEDERRALQAFMAAWEQADTARLISLLSDDVRWAMPPAPLWFDGIEAVKRLLGLYPIDWQGRVFRLFPSAANRQPAAVSYISRDGREPFGNPGVHVLRVRDGKIAEITTFGPELCGAFELAPQMRE